MRKILVSVLLGLISQCRAEEQELPGFEIEFRLDDPCDPPAKFNLVNPIQSFDYVIGSPAIT